LFIFPDFASLFVSPTCDVFLSLIYVYFSLLFSPFVNHPVAIVFIFVLFFPILTIWSFFCDLLLWPQWMTFYRTKYFCSWTKYFCSWTNICSNDDMIWSQKSKLFWRIHLLLNEYSSGLTFGHPLLLLFYWCRHEQNEVFFRTFSKTPAPPKSQKVEWRSWLHFDFDCATFYFFGMKVSEIKTFELLRIFDRFNVQLNSLKTSTETDCYFGSSFRNLFCLYLVSIFIRH
jgi:hypothetical protein